MDFKFDEKKISMTVKFEPYIPTAVYKCLVKIALSLIPQNELSSFQKAIKWIQHEDHSKKILNPQIVFYKFVPGVNPNKGLSLIILRRKQNATVIPYCYMVLGFGNFIYQLIIPSQNDFIDGKTVKYTYYSFPSPWELNGISLVPDMFDLSGHEKITDSEKIITFTYDKIEKFDKEEDMKNL